METLNIIANEKSIELPEKDRVCKYCGIEIKIKRICKKCSCKKSNERLKKEGYFNKYYEENKNNFKDYYIKNKQHIKEYNMEKNGISEIRPVGRPKIIREGQIKKEDCS